MQTGTLRVVAVMAVRNEGRVVAGAIDHLVRQDVDVYLLDNGSDDGTPEIVREHAGHRLVGLEDVPFDGVFRWREMLRRKERVFQHVEADWVLHVDADERHLPPSGFDTLAEALTVVAADGYDQVEFDEFTFVPTAEEPDHDHPDFEETLRTYYHFRPAPQHLVRAYKRGSGAIEIAWSGGHRPTTLEQRRLSPTVFPMRHYLFLSAAHAVRKYGERPYEASELADGWHSWRDEVTADIPLPPARLLRRDNGVDDLDRSDPWSRHWLDRRGER